MTTFSSDWGRTGIRLYTVYSTYGTYKVYNMHFIAGQPILAQTDTHPNIYTVHTRTPPAKVDTNFANKIRKSSSVHFTFLRMLK